MSAIQVRYGSGFLRPAALAMRRRVRALQDRAAQLPQYQPPTHHCFHAGMYCRWVELDAGSLIVGKVHKREHLLMVVSGRLALTLDDHVEAIEGFAVIPCQAGAQRAIKALTAATMATVHICAATTVEAAERELVEDDPDATFGPGNILKQRPSEVIP